MARWSASFDDAHALLGTINIDGLTQRLTEAARQPTIDHMRRVAADIAGGLEATSALVMPAQRD